MLVLDGEGYALDAVYVHTPSEHTLNGMLPFFLFQFTCFNGTKVQVLTQKAMVGMHADAELQLMLRKPGRGAGTQFTCFTITNVPILELKAGACRTCRSW